MLTTRFTELVGCAVPIQQAGMGALSTPRLGAAVAEAGAQGVVSVTGESPDLIATLLDEARRGTTGAVGANYVVPLVDPALARESVAVAAARTRVVDFPTRRWSRSSMPMARWPAGRSAPERRPLPPPTPVAT